MGLRETLQAAAVTAVTAAGNIAVSTNYESIVSATYNASAGTNAASISTVGGVSVIFDVFTLRAADGTLITTEDKKALIPALSLPSITPDAKDRIIESGTVWRVVESKIDPAGALWELRVRKA